MHGFGSTIQENAKPNPYGLGKPWKRMLTKACLYVGDSVEDILMVGKAKEEMGPDVESIGA